MSCNIEKTLIHPIDKTAYKETIHEDFVSREEFINQTGIFVSPEYFEYIYDMEFKESGVSAEEFVQDYEEKFSACVQEIPLHGIFKYEVMDEEVNCVGEYDDCYEPNIWEIMNTLARNSKAQFDKRYDLIEQYNGMIDKVQKIPDEMLALTKFIRQLCLQNDIVNGLLECLANNEVCATEIIENEFLKDIWDISMNQLKMILQEVSKNTELLKQVGYYMHYDPCTILCMQPTLSLAETMSKDRLMPMVRDTPALRDKINEKSRTSGNTIFKKAFPGGRITMTGANSPTELRSRPIRILLADEIDAYPPTAGAEGDPLILAGKRLTTYWNRKEVDTSTPTVKGASRIEMEYEHSTMEEWNVPCPSCGELQPLEWGNLTYKIDADGEVESITYACTKCGCIHSEIEWKDHFNEGRYIAKYPNRKVRGFHFNSLASTFFGWEKIVKGFIEADQALKKGNIELMKSWVNTELGQTWEEEGEKASKDDLLKRREKYRCEVPEEVIALTAGIDTQDDRFEIEVVGWGVGHESYGIIYKRIYGDLKQAEVWKNLDEFLLQKFKKADGTELRIICACMDSGGHFTNKVYKFCKARTARKIFAIKGKDGTDRPYIPKPSKNNREQTYLFTLGVDTGKSLLLQRLQIEEEGPGYCHFPKDENNNIRGYDEDYFKGLTAEKQVLRYKKGRPYFVWELTGETKRNEPLDCRNYAQAAIEITGLTLKEPPQKAAGNTQTPQRKARRRGNRSGGIT